MRSTRRHGGDNGYRSAEDYANEGRGYERPTSYSDRYRFERDDTDYRGQGNERNDNRWNDQADNPNRNSNRNENNNRNREWSNHQSGWNDNGSNWGNRGVQNNDRYDSEPNRNFNRGRNEYGSSNMNNYDDRRYPQDNGYRNRQDNRGNDSYYNSQNDFLDDEKDVYGDRMTNRNGYNEDPNNDHRSRSYQNNHYGNLWNRDNILNTNTARRSRQGFGSRSKENIQDWDSQDGSPSNKNR